MDEPSASLMWRAPFSPARGVATPSAAGGACTVDISAPIRMFSHGSVLKTASQMWPVPFIGYRNCAFGPHAGASCGARSEGAAQARAQQRAGRGRTRAARS